MEHIKNPTALIPVHQPLSRYCGRVGWSGARFTPSTAILSNTWAPLMFIDCSEANWVALIAADDVAQITDELSAFIFEAAPTWWNLMSASCLRCAQYIENDNSEWVKSIMIRELSWVRATRQIRITRSDLHAFNAFNAIHTGIRRLEWAFVALPENLGREHIASPECVLIGQGYQKGELDMFEHCTKLHEPLHQLLLRTIQEKIQDKIRQVQSTDQVLKLHIMRFGSGDLQEQPWLWTHTNKGIEELIVELARHTPDIDGWKSLILKWNEHRTRSRPPNLPAWNNRWNVAKTATRWLHGSQQRGLAGFVV